MATLAEKCILLGVTGGIAAYKAAELTRMLRREGAEVRVAMTRAATAFVAPLTFQALSGNPVHTQLLDPQEESAMDHIRLARWADAVLVAPATADCIARLRAGLADDLLTTVCLATQAPILLAPAMNHAMWAHPATQDNLCILQARGVRVLGPAVGEQACGETGLGRMVEPAEIIAALAGLSGGGLLAGLTVLVSAGPTREALDPVRYLGNRSSGRMGYAIAEACTAAGAGVVLVSGPTSLAVPRIREFVRVESAAEMYDAVLARAPAADIYIGAAAVADYRPAHADAHKIKKTGPELILALERTKDILAAVASSVPRPFTVGFAAETSHLEEYALEKLREKRLDMVAANLVGPGQGFDSEDNALLVCWDGGQAQLPLASKQRLAGQLIALIAERYMERNYAKNPA